MGFFEPPPCPPEPPEPRPLVWIGPSDNVVGVAVPVRLILGRTEEAAVVLDGLSAYPNGFELTLSVRLRRRRDRPFWSPLELWAGEARTGLPGDLLRFGVQFADGGKATNLSGHPFPDPGGEPAGPVLIQRGGGGGGARWDQAYWVWPLPPPGPLAFVCEWPSEGIPLTRAEIDADLVLEAGARAETLWEEPEGGSGGAVGWVSYPV